MRLNYFCTPWLTSAHTHIHPHTGTWGKHSWSAGVAPSCDCKLLLTGLWLRVPWLPIMYYSACIQRLSEELLHELSRSSILIVHYYHIIILGGEILILLVTVWKSFPWCDAAFALQGRVRTFWEAAAEFLKRVTPLPPAPSSDCIVRAPHSRVVRATSNEMPCRDAHTHLLYVCTLTHSNLLLLVVLFFFFLFPGFCIFWFVNRSFVRADVINSILVTTLYLSCFSPHLCIWLWCVYLQRNS